MKLFIINFFTFIFATVVIFSAINILQSYNNNQPVQNKLKYSVINNPSKNFDGIIMGSSHVALSIKPKLLKNTNISFYNFAFNGSNPEYNYKWYDNLLKDKQNQVKYCVIGIDWFMFDSYALQRKFEQDSEYFKISLFLKLLFSINNIDKKQLILERFPFIKYRKEIISSLEGQSGDPFFPIQTYDNGYIAFQPIFDSTTYIANAKFNIDKIQVYYLKKLISNLITNKIKIIFVMTPEYNISPTLYKRMKSLEIINLIAEKYNIPILNFNTTLRSNINDNINYFSDWGHMNNEGAKVFSIFLSKEINKIKKTKY